MTSATAITTNDEDYRRYLSEVEHRAEQERILEQERLNQDRMSGIECGKIRRRKVIRIFVGIGVFWLILSFIAFKSSFIAFLFAGGYSLAIALIIGIELFSWRKK